MSDRSNRDSFGIGLLERGDCRDEVAQLAISSYLDGEADASERILAENHLTECLTCQARIVNWRQEARIVSSPMFSESVAYQVQSEVRAALQPFLAKDALKTSNKAKAGQTTPRAFPRLAWMSGAALLAVAAFTFLMAQFNMSGPLLLNSQMTAAITMSAPSTATVVASGPFGFSQMSSRTLAATPTAASAPFALPVSLESALNGATAVRYYPAPEGRFAGYTAAVAWYGDKSNRLWIIDQLHRESEVSLAALGGPNEVVRFYYDDPQAVIWSERGAIVSYQLSDATVSDWGLVVPQAGEISAARLVQPPTAAALANRPSYSPVPRPTS